MWVRWYSNVICIFLLVILSIFSCAFWTFIYYSWINVFFQIFCPFLNWVIWILWSHKFLFTFVILIPYQIYNLQIFSLVSETAFVNCHLMHKSFLPLMYVVPFVYIFFCCLYFWCHTQEISVRSNYTKQVPCVFFQEF